MHEPRTDANQNSPVTRSNNPQKQSRTPKQPDTDAKSTTKRVNTTGGIDINGMHGS